MLNILYFDTRFEIPVDKLWVWLAYLLSYRSHPCLAPKVQTKKRDILFGSSVLVEFWCVENFYILKTN